MVESSDPQIQAMIANMPEKTGKSLQAWFKVIAAAGLEKHGDILNLLKGEHGVTHGYANQISIFYRQQLEGGPPSEVDLVEAQYAGDKAGLRPIYEAVLQAITDFGPDIEVAPKKTYVSLRRSKQFAIVQAATRSRVDLGLILKDASPTGRLEGGTVFGGMCTHLVRLTSPSEVDKEVAAWLRQAYDSA